VVTDLGSNTVSVLLGNGDGTFQPLAAYVVGYGSTCVAAGDLNGDGKPDLVVSLNSGRGLAVLLGNGDGTFQPARRYPLGAYASFLVLADFNGDGKPDIAVSVYNKRHRHVSGFAILLGNGDGTFQPQVNHSGLNNGPLAVGDFNGDGRADLIVGSGSVGALEVLLGDGRGGFKRSKPYDALGTVYLMADFNGDGRQDVAAAGGGFVSLLLGQKTGPIVQRVNYAVGDSGYSYPAIAAADFNRDGKLDLAVPDSSTDKVYVLMNTTR
jgi:hypothetical protein